MQCEPSPGTCQVNVPAPGMALVFLSDIAYQEVEPAPSSTVTFATTSVTNALVTVTVNPSALSTSNGNGSIVLAGTDRHNGGSAASACMMLSVLIAALTGFGVLGRV